MGPAYSRGTLRGLGGDEETASAAALTPRERVHCLTASPSGPPAPASPVQLPRQTSACVGARQGAGSPGVGTGLLAVGKVWALPYGGIFF